MTDPDWRVLVPVAVLEGETVPEAVVDLLATLSVVVLGYHVLPEQTAPGQARIQFEERAQSRLDDLAAAFREAGGDCETRLVFTHDEEQTLDRVADETGCEAILLPNPAARVGRLFVPLRGGSDVDRLTAFVAALIGGREIGVTLARIDGHDDTDGAVVDDAAARLRDRGVPADAIDRASVAPGAPAEAIADAAADHDAVVMDEGEPSLRSFLFGAIAERVAARSLGPVAVVRRERVPDAEGD